MSLLDRYVHAVRKQLPRKDRDDIAAELRVILLSQIEAAEAGTGRPLTDDDIAIILRRYGAPAAVAARYGAREHLIGPAVFPHYTYVVRLILWILIPLLTLWAGVTAFTADDPVASTARVVWTGILIVLGNLAIVTLVFARIERLKDQLEWTGTWDPRELDAMPELRASIPRWESIGALGMMTFWLLWWTDVLPINRWIFGPLSLAAAPIWDVLTPAILTLMAASIAADAIAIARPRWVTFYEGAGVLIELGILGVLFRALRAPELIVVTDPASAGARLVGLANAGLSIALLVWMAVVVISLVLTVRRLIASFRLTKHASVAA